MIHQSLSMKRQQFFLDADSDGHGTPYQTTRACTQPAGYVSNNDDCRDDNPAVFYGAVEICDGIDNDCDTLPDDADGGVEPYPWLSCNQRFSHLLPTFELQEKSQVTMRV